MFSAYFYINMFLIDHLEISASTSRDQHRHCKNFIYTLGIFYEKIEHLCQIHVNILLFGISIFLLQLLISIKFPTPTVAKLPGKTSMVEYFLSALADLPGSAV